jgi:hypothetical protein
VRTACVQGRAEGSAEGSHDRLSTTLATELDRCSDDLAAELAMPSGSGREVGERLRGMLSQPLPLWSAVSGQG